MLGVVCIIGCPVQLIREVFLRLPFRRRRRHTFASLWGACLSFGSLWRANPFGDSCVLGVHLSKVCWGLIRLSKSPSSDFISSLAVGRFAAKQGSLRSPRGRLIASLRSDILSSWGVHLSKSLLNLRKGYINMCLVNRLKRLSFRSLLLNFALD